MLVCTELNFHARTLNNINTIIGNLSSSMESGTETAAAVSRFEGAGEASGVNEDDELERVMNKITLRERQKTQNMAAIRKVLHLGYELPAPSGQGTKWGTTSLAAVKAKDWSLPKDLDGSKPDVMVALELEHGIRALVFTH